MHTCLIMVESNLHWTTHLLQQTLVLVKMCWRVLQDVLKTPSLNIFLSSKMSWRRLQDVSARRLLEDNVITNTSWRRFANTSWRHLERWERLRWRRLQDIFKAYWETRNVCWDNNEILTYRCKAPPIAQ